MFTEQLVHLLLSVLYYFITVLLYYSITVLLWPLSYRMSFGFRMLSKH